MPKACNTPVHACNTVLQGILERRRTRTLCLGGPRTVFLQPPGAKSSRWEEEHPETDLRRFRAHSGSVANRNRENEPSRSLARSRIKLTDPNPNLLYIDVRRRLYFIHLIIARSSHWYLLPPPLEQI